MLISLIIAFTALLITFWYIQWKYHTKYLQKFPGPTPLPIIGNALYFRTRSKILPSLMEIHKNYGSTCLISIGFGPVILSITNLKFIEFLLGCPALIDKARDYRFLHNWLGTGLLTSTGIKWKKHRKILTPAFHFNILEQFVKVFNAYSDILVEKLKPEIDKNSSNIYPFVTLASLDIICATTMGIKINAQEYSTSDYVLSVKEMCRIAVRRSTNFIKMNENLYKYTNDYQRDQKYIKILHNHTNSIINLRKQKLEHKDKCGTNDCKSDDIIVNKKKTFLDILLNHKAKYGDITDENIREEVDTFMFAGHDSSASAITFILYNLATNSIVQTKVMQELIRVLDNNFDKQATYKDLKEMKYLEMVIKESLRLHPPAPIFARNVREDMKYDDTILPKDLTLAINTLCLHRDPNIYPNPDYFDPERFSLENQQNRSPYAYIPFGAGLRNCIGQKFAMLEMKAVVVKVLINYELLPSIPEIKPVLVVDITLKSETGVHIRLKKRTF